MKKKRAEKRREVKRKIHFNLLLTFERNFAYKVSTLFAFLFPYELNGIESQIEREEQIKDSRGYVPYVNGY